MQTILVIDDDKDICLMLSKFLTKNDYQVEIAYKGEDGLRTLRNHHVDLILCDYRLPDYTGVEMLQKIKVLSPTVAVVIITGYSDVRTAVETFRYGAGDYVTKPLFPDELLVTIRETLEKSKQRNSVPREADNSKTKSKGARSEGMSTADFIVGKS